MLVGEMSAAAPALRSERAAALSAELTTSVASLDVACRERASDKQLKALQAVDAGLDEFLQLAKQSKYDVTAREDINTYSGATGVLYNKFLFRAGAPGN